METLPRHLEQRQPTASRRYKEEINAKALTTRAFFQQSDLDAIITKISAKSYIYYIPNITDGKPDKPSVLC
jgi:hypothetical protein